MESVTAAFGIIAACLTTGSWVPQALHTIRTRDASGLTWSHLAMFGSGVALWMVYGALKSDVAVFGANIVTLVLVLRIVFVKRFGR